MNVPDRLKQLMDERGLTMYALAKASGLHWQTIKNLFSRTSNPSVATMTSICKGLGITMSQFFLEEDETTITLTEEQTLWLNRIAAASDDERKVLSDMLDVFEKNRVSV